LFLGALRVISLQSSSSASASASASSFASASLTDLDFPAPELDTPRTDLHGGMPFPRLKLDEF
jgi:hypothetical protein